MPKPRVVFSANTSWYLYNYYRNTFTAFMREGYRVYAASPVDAYTDKLKALGCVHVPLPIKPASKNPLREAMALLRFFNLYRRAKPAMAFHFTIKCNLYGSFAAGMLGVPHANSVSGLGSAFNSPGLFSGAIKWLYRILQRKAGRVFFQNRTDCDFMLRGGLVTPEQAFVLPGSGVDLAHFRPEAATEEKPFAFVFAGRIIWEKGFPYLPEAMRLVKAESGVEVECRIYGFLEADNPKYVPAETLKGWEAEGLLRYHGPLEDVREAYRRADCVVLPTYYREGVPKSLLEAAAMGRPLIATDLPGCREAVVDGVNGFICAPRDARDLADAMLRMVRLDAGTRRALGARGRERVENGFSEEHIIRKYLATASLLSVHKPDASLSK